ncbi:MAG: DUF5615 family PIN-like protein [bacterium]|nr:DUF5615 family PIN-like protein [bacterium]
MTSQPVTSRQRPSIRFIFDENLPWRVAAALDILQFKTTYVGNQHHSNIPSRGSSDEEVLAFAQRTSQVIVTSNLDMILLCAERCQAVIWIDPRGRQFRREDLVLLVFKNIADWSGRLQVAGGPVCIRALRTKTDTLSLDEARGHAYRRMRRIAAALTRKKLQNPLDPVMSLEENPK